MPAGGVGMGQEAELSSACLGEGLSRERLSTRTPTASQGMLVPPHTSKFQGTKAGFSCQRTGLHVGDRCLPGLGIRVAPQGVGVARFLAPTAVTAWRRATWEAGSARPSVGLTASPR